MFKGNNDELKQYLDTVSKQMDNNKPLSKEVLITNAIITLNKLMIEIEELEDLILNKSNIIHQNSLLILGAELELQIQEVKKIRQRNLKQ
ncbi:MAG: hypothetical protein ACI4F2_06380 [Acutalibacteraceae bacterium]